MQAWCWLNSQSDWLKILESWVQAPVVPLKLNTRWVDSTCHPSEASEMSTSLLVTGVIAAGARLHPQKIFKKIVLLSNC